MLIVAETYRQETMFPSLASTAPQGNTEFEWTCPVFSSHGVSSQAPVTVTDLQPNTTSLCAFEICPEEVYSVNFTHCEGDGGGSVGQLSLFSYANDQLLGQGLCGETLYVDNAGYTSCRLVTVYQTCLLLPGGLTGSSCGGEVHIRGEMLNTVEITLPTVPFQVGELISFNISQLTMNEGYLHSLETVNASSASSTSLILAVYQSKLLVSQTSCHFYSVAQDDLVDYLDKVIWNGRQGIVEMPNYVISGFGSTYKIVLWVHRGSTGVSKLGESADFQVQESINLQLDVGYYTRGSHIAGSWGFGGGGAFQSMPGDAIALYEIDGNG
jgi:hypothetical protein